MLALSPIMPPPLHLSWAPARPAQGEPLVALVLPLVAEDHPAPLAEERQGEPLVALVLLVACLLYTSPSPRDRTRSRMPSSA